MLSVNPLRGKNNEKGFSFKMKILVHICCAPCAVFCFPRLREEFDEVMGLWYNPNIHPFEEYQKRLEAVRKWAQKTGIRVIYEDKYELKEFLREVVYRESYRCRICYYLRFKKAAIFARRGRFDYWEKNSGLNLTLNLSEKAGGKVENFQKAWDFTISSIADVYTAKRKNLNPG